MSLEDESSNGEICGDFELEFESSKGWLASFLVFPSTDTSADSIEQMSRR